MRKYLRMFVLAILGGAAIGIGGIVYLSLENKLAGAIMFATGLYGICVHGLNLFTGKVGYLVNEKPGYLINLGVIWLGNLLGAWLTGAGVHASRIAGSGIVEKAQSMCEVKVNDSMLSLLILGIFCGALMFIAVDGYKQCKNPAIIVMCVAAFILCGFEHCIADMVYLSIANMWSLQSLLCIVVISIGNGIGGMLILLAKRLKEN